MKQDENVNVHSS